MRHAQLSMAKDRHSNHCRSRRCQRRFGCWQHPPRCDSDCCADPKGDEITVLGDAWSANRHDASRVSLQATNVALRKHRSLTTGGANYLLREFLMDVPWPRQGFPQNWQTRQNPLICDCDVVSSRTVSSLLKKVERALLPVGFQVESWARVPTLQDDSTGC